MGYYTEIQVDIVLNEDAPIGVISKLADGTMWDELAQAKFGRIPDMYSVSEEPELPIEHIFGKSTRWSQIFNTSTTIFNIEDKRLKIKAEIKAYDDIYEHLVDWLLPFTLNGTIITRGECQDEWTTELLIE